MFYLYCRVSTVEKGTRLVVVLYNASTGYIQRMGACVLPFLG